MLRPGSGEPGYFGCAPPPYKALKTQNRQQIVDLPFGPFPPLAGGAGGVGHLELPRKGPLLPGEVPDEA